MAQAHAHKSQQEMEEMHKFWCEDKWETSVLCKAVRFTQQQEEAATRENRAIKHPEEMPSQEEVATCLLSMQGDGCRVHPTHP